MDKQLKSEWDGALNALLTLEKSKRQHFALLIIGLAKCYTDSESNHAVVIINDSEKLAMFSAGADEMQAAEMVQMASSVLHAEVTADAPAKEMFN